MIALVPGTGKAPASPGWAYERLLMKKVYQRAAGSRFLARDYIPCRGPILLGPDPWPRFLRVVLT